jgi:glycosyltransferase involved in cell wall biosynthesis
MSIHGLQMGGAEKFFTTLARALASRHDLCCYIPCLASGDSMMIRRLEGIKTISIPVFTKLGYKIFYKLRQMIIGRFPSIDIEASLHRIILRRLRRRWSMDVVNTHLIGASSYCCDAFSGDSVPIIETDHGHYYFPDSAKDLRASTIFNRLDGLACPSLSNLNFSLNLPWKANLQRRVVHYGYEPDIPRRRRISEPECISLGLVARGVIWKGWIEALAAARIAKRNSAMPIKLIFVGSGPCLDEIAQTLSAEDRTWVHLMGQQDRPETLISEFDIGLLPTYLPGESLPNSIIEYLAHQVPVITTAVGGIPEMLDTKDGPAGIFVPQELDGRASVADLSEAMMTLINQPALRTELSRRAGLASHRFDLDHCVAAYEQFFTELIPA